MSGNHFCHICGGLVDLIKLQPSGVRFCECEKRFTQLRADNERLTKQTSSYRQLVCSMEKTRTLLLRKLEKNKAAIDTLASEREANMVLTEENERLKAELKSIDGALDDLRANLTLTTAEIIWEIKTELAEAKKDAERGD